MWGNSYDVDDFLRASDEQIERYTFNERRFEALARETVNRQNELRGKQSEAFASLAETLIPDLSDAVSVAAIAERLGLQELITLHSRLLETVSRNAFRIREIEASDTYANRELLRLRTETKRRELEPLLQHTETEWRKLQSQEKLSDLIARGYDTDTYEHRGWWRFFNRQFLDDWRCADAACESFGVANFAELRTAYNDRAEQIQVLGRDRDALRREDAAVADLETERERLLQTNADLPRETYRKMGERVAAILQNGASLLTDRLSNPDALRSRLREISGMTAQVEYLDGVKAQAEREVAGVVERADKIRDERERYRSNPRRYRNKRFTGEQWDKRFGEHRTARYDGAYNRYRRASDTVYVFHDYDRGSGLRDFLWWDVMTDGRMDGNFLPEVRSWRDDNPDYRYERDYDSSPQSSAFESDNFGSDPS